MPGLIESHGHYNELGEQAERIMQSVPGTRSAFAERGASLFVSAASLARVLERWSSGVLSHETIAAIVARPAQHRDRSGEHDHGNLGTGTDPGEELDPVAVRHRQPGRRHGVVGDEHLGPDVVEPDERSGPGLRPDHRRHRERGVGDRRRTYREIARQAGRQVEDLAAGVSTGGQPRLVFQGPTVWRVAITQAAAV